MPPCEYRGVIFSQRWLGKPYAVEGLILAFDRLMLIVCSHLLIKNILHLTSPISFMGKGFFDRLDNRLSAVLVFERKKP